MSEKPKSPQQSLSEISHLFLTGLRERQSGAAPAPQRKPPASNTPRPAVSIDITPEEFSSGGDGGHQVSLCAVIAHHLGTGALPRVREYARHAATASGRVGLIELGDDGLRLTCFDSSPLGNLDDASGDEQATGPEPVNGRRIAEAISEMSWDIQRWILFLPGGLRSERARRLLGQIEHWTLLVGADDESIVAAYRVVKSAAENANCSMSLAVFGAEDESHGTMVHRKLAAASKRFLDRNVDCEGRVTEVSSVSEHIALWCRASAGDGEHWTAVMDLAKKCAEPAPRQAALPQPVAAPVVAEPVLAEPAAEPVAEPIEEAAPVAAAVEVAEEQPAALRITPMEKTIDAGADEVLELPLAGDARGNSDAILACVMQRNTQWVGCPIKAPMSGSTAVAVDRDGRLILIAVSAGELADLQGASRGYGWLIENRPLVRMALPQMNIDAGAMPRLVLCVDQALTSAGPLAAILQNANVSIQTYRRLRWGERSGLLLAAA